KSLINYEEELLKLKDYLAGEDDPIKRQDKRDEIMGKIWDLIEHQDDDLKHFADDMKDVNIKVRDWLDQDIDKLADLLRDANQVQIHKLQRILARAEDEERAIWEAKLGEALALFLPDSDKALEQITKSNDLDSPMGGGGGGWWGGWWSSSVSDQDEDNFDFTNYNTAASPNPLQSVQSVPEPSSIISLIALGGLGLLTRKRVK
ncbi:MAG TPA: hypothetical protein DCF68_05715, partial [Cyanothece sp. UBA12306]|nr:hypothetical protein [Cyanothece sp. UBA12306]